MLTRESMKILSVIVLLTLSACSSSTKRQSSNLLLNRDCNPNSARLLGKNYIHEDEKLNNTQFDQCPKAEDTSYQPHEKRASSVKEAAVGTTIHKCEVDFEGSNFAVTNKVLQDAKTKVIELCKKQKKSKGCNKVKCIEL